MAQKLSKEEVALAEEVIPDIGLIQYELANDVDPSTLTDTLARKLTARTRHAIARHLIHMALNEKEPKLALEAIKEIWDRIEGKSRQSIVQSRGVRDPLLEIYKQVFDSPRIIPNGNYRILEAEGSSK